MHPLLNVRTNPSQLFDKPNCDKSYFGPGRHFGSGIRSMSSSDTCRASRRVEDLATFCSLSMIPIDLSCNLCVV